MRETITEAGYDFVSYDANTGELIVHDPGYDVNELWIERPEGHSGYGLVWNGKTFEYVSQIPLERDDR